MADDKHSKFRLRLHFDESISFGEDEEEKRKCWFLCHKTSTISDLSNSIIKDFNLRTQCPDGITLCLEQFALIANQNIDILRETDIVTVKKKLISKKRASVSQQKDSAKKPKVAPKKEAIESDSDSSEESSEEESEEESSSEDEEPTPPKKTTTNAKPTQPPKSSPKQETVSKPAPKLPQQKSVTPAPKATTQPVKQAALPKVAPKAAAVIKKKASDIESDSDSSEEEQPKPKNAPKPVQPVKTTTAPKVAPTTNHPQSKGHIKFDDQEEAPTKKNEMKSSNNTNKANGKPTTPTGKPNNNNLPKTAIQQQDRLENVSVILQRGTTNNNNNNYHNNGYQKPAKVKPIRDYNSFPLLQQKDTPQLGDLLAFNMLDLCAWNPEVVRKEGVVEAYSAKDDTITIRIDSSFKVPTSKNMPQSLLKAQSKENRYLTFQDWDEAMEEEEEEESETDDVMTVSRQDLSDIRIIERKA